MTMTPQMRAAWRHMNAVLDAKHAGTATEQDYRTAWDAFAAIADAEATPESAAEAAAFNQRVLDDLAAMPDVGWREP